MVFELELTPKTKRPAGAPCCEPVVYPDVERDQAVRMASIAKALGDPVRLQLVDVLRKHAGKVCVCELVPLFDLSQPTVSHHLKVLRDAGHRRLRTRGAMGLLLRDPRRTEGAINMAELTDIRETVRPEIRRGRRGGRRRASSSRRARSSPSRAAAALTSLYCCSPADETGVFGSALYDEARGEQLPDDAVMASLGCGVPTAVAELHGRRDRP